MPLSGALECQAALHVEGERVEQPDSAVARSAISTVFFIDSVQWLIGYALVASALDVLWKSSPPISTAPKMAASVSWTRGGGFFEVIP